MRFSRRQIVSRAYRIPRIRFEENDTSLTSFAGLVIVQQLFERLELKRRLSECFGHLRSSAAYGTGRVVLWLIVHILLGFRKLRDRDFYHDDPLVRRTLGVNRLPDVSTISRALKDLDERAVESYRGLNRDLVLERLEEECLARVTLDFDGSVLATGRHAEGTAIGYNPRKKGTRSYYPLFCNVAQTAQVLDLHHRPGNVHDSNGARPFIQDCLETVRDRVPHAALEARLDAAFFDQEQILELALQGTEFTVSVPWARFPRLKEIIEGRRRWRRIDEDTSYFECDWKPESWLMEFRVLVIRQRKAQPTKGPLQLDLFEPKSHRYEYQVILTNKRQRAATVMRFHHGRGAQEGVFAETKSCCQMDYIPVRTWLGNQVYCLSAVMAHNLSRELQIQAGSRQYHTTAKRRNLWGFETLATLRQRWIHRAGRLIRPQGRLTLILGGNDRLQTEWATYLNN